MVRKGLLLLALLLLCGSLIYGAAGRIELVLNPYAGVDWDQVQALKTNLHTHTTQSDGVMPPPRVIGEYQARGYRVLALTDHNTCTFPWAEFGAAANQMVAVPGNELSRHHHTSSLFTAYETPATDLNVALDGLRDAGGVGVLNHPAMHWPALVQGETSIAVRLDDPLRQLTRGDFTVAAWFRTTNPSRHILMGNYEGGQTASLNLELHTDNRVRLFIQPLTGAVADLNVPAADHQIDTRDGQWHHLAGLRRGQTVQLYLDGRPVGELADTAGAYELHGDRYYLGRDHRAGATQLSGDLDDAAIWSRALSAEEIGTLAAGQMVTNGLLAAYDFEAGGELGADLTGQHPAAVQAGGSRSQVTDVPSALAGRSKSALRFGSTGTPGSVPDSAVAFYKDLFTRYPNLVGMEVLNGTRPLNEYPLDRELWDRLLTEMMPDRPVWGVANDDTHQMVHLGRDWTVMLTPTADAESVRKTLVGGAFTFSTTRLTSTGLASPYWTPQVTGIEHDAAAGRITVRAEQGGQPLPDEAYVWISCGQEVARGPVLDYRATAGVKTYVRAEITGDGGVTYTQPFGLR